VSGFLERVKSFLPGKSFENSIFLVAGLGNPGPEYLDTRHNVGQMVIERLADSLKINFADEPKGAIAEVSLGEKHLFLIKPATFVNSSGPAIKAVATKLKILPANLIVVHDDIDLDFPVLKIKQGGSSGGQRGLNSIIAALSSDEFLRLRLGVGRPPGRMDPADFVLSPFTPKEWTEMDVVISSAAEAVLAVVREGVTAAMNRYN